jgi:flavin reductase (DIM6/NTAB) family NADH-FMN oxidoreductase RutF
MSGDGQSGVERAFNEIVGELDYPMLVVTAAAGDAVGGCLVGFATQSSISPPRFLVCLSKRNRTCELAADAELLGVHFLSDGDDDLARLFGGETGHEIDKFERVDWQPGPEGTPLLDRCRNRFVGRILERTDAGDHIAILLEPVEAERGEPVRPFPFHRAKRIDPGHEA